MATRPGWVGIVSEYFSTLDADAKARYIEKLKKYDIKEDPLLACADSESSGWVRNDLGHKSHMGISTTTSLTPKVHFQRRVLRPSKAWKHISI